MRTMEVFLLAAFAAGAPGVAQDAVESSIDSIFAALADAKSPGFAVLVHKDGRTVFERGYGVADLRSLRKIDVKTDFRLASFTKQFTAMSIMLLVRDGKLRYDEPITDVFTEFPTYGRAITIRHLLTHTGGLPDYEDLMGPTWTARHQIQDDEVLSLLEHQIALKFAPGTKWAYSNSGYVVLGLIVAKASGEPFWQFLHDRIFGPLGMGQTIAFVKGTNIAPHRAFGHTKESGGFVETDQSPTSATLGDGGVYSNLEDLAKWDAALAAHTLLGEKEMREALAPVKLNDQSEPTAEGKPVSYGFGWFLDPYKGHPRMWHSGSTLGFRTVIDRFTNEKVTVVILCNRTDVDPSELALKVVDTLWKL
ncbi:MAG: serine hydrolase domain-containing protein [Bryobacteraceae bacterium]